MSVTTSREPSIMPRQASPQSKEALQEASPTRDRSHRAELVREPVSRGWGDSYGVCLLDASGGPVANAHVLLVARMADRTIESVAMGTLLEAGIYRGTVPTNGSTPVDLRVLTTGGEFFEVPVAPRDGRTTSSAAPETSTR